MKIMTFAIALTLACTGAAGFFYLQNQTLQKQILTAEQSCKQHTAELQANYKTKIDALLARLPADSELHRTVTVELEATPKIEKLVSYGHKVRAVIHKYEFILDTAQIEESDKKRLRRVLTERETLAAQLEQAAGDPSANTGELETRLAKAEDEIANLLKDPMDYTRYEYLRERSL